jgi:hypothetical protein
MCQRFRPRPRPTVPGHWCHRPTTAIRRPSGPCQRPSWPCAAATAAAPPQRSRALSPAATSAPPTQPWILVAVERRRPPPRNPVKVRATAGGGAVLPAPTGVVRSTVARPHVCHGPSSCGWLLFGQDEVLHDRDLGPDDCPRQGSQVRWVGFWGGTGGWSTSSSQGREPCLLLCSCSMLPAAAARQRRCRTFTPVGRRGTRVSATRLTRRRSMRSSRSCATPATSGTAIAQRVDRRALACRATDQRGALAHRDRSGRTARVDFGRAWQERSPPPGRDGRVGVDGARTMAIRARDADDEARTCGARAIYVPEADAMRTGAPSLISGIGRCFILPAAYASGSCGRLRSRELVRQTAGICAASNLQVDGNTTNGDDHDLAD